MGSGRDLTCTIPRQDFDIFSPMDLVEEAILGWSAEYYSKALTAGTLALLVQYPVQ